MQVVILAGGLGSRLSEETRSRPKPMVEIGGRPILWHIMKLYSSHGLNDFVICCGYMGHVIKEYFANYYLHSSDVTIDTRRNVVEYHKSSSEDWRITLVDTGAETLTGGRLRRVRGYLKPGETFCMTYGDGVSDIDITREIAFHKSHGKEATIAAVAPPGRYGALDTDGTSVRRFTEKPPGDKAYINGGFFVLEPRAIDRVTGDDVGWERAPLEAIAADGQLEAFFHNGFWAAMDTLRDKNHLEELWTAGRAPWKTWDV